MIVFKEVLDNIARVERMLTMPGGSLLLAGRSGVGRRTAVLLVAHMHQMELITPKINRSYGIKQFKTDLKTVPVIPLCVLLMVMVNAPSFRVQWHGVVGGGVA